MMKEVCAQCLQKHVDPETGKEDDHLLLLQPGSGAWTASTSRTWRRACGRTRVQEKLANLWLDHLLQGQNLPHV